MMRNLNQRVFMTVTATILVAACGTLAGFLVGRAILLRVAESKLLQFASLIQRESEASSSESRTLLATLKASPYPYCSDAELAYFRSLIFKSDHLNDAGRIFNGRIDCSAVLGRPAHPFQLSVPDFSQQDGTKVYRNIGPLRIGTGTPLVSLQLGDSYVEFSPYRRSQWETAPMHYTLTVTDSSRPPSGLFSSAPPQASAEILTRDGQARLNNSLFVTRCVPRYFNCVTTYMSIPEALNADPGQMTAYTVLGGLTGGCFGFIFSLLYGRSRGMEQQLRRAIARGTLRVVYQPIVNLASRRIVGAEALVRWTDEEGFAVGPDIFVKLAEERGFVGGITRFVVRQVLRDFSDTLHNHPDFHLSVNATATDLADPRFLPMLDSFLKQSLVEARSLAIEITESSTARHDVAMETIRRLRHRGFSVHIDDFGTGYSSLSYLHALSIDAIKIDRSFTQAIGTEAVTVAILPQILSMAEALNLRVVVEGVETELQAGYFIAAAQPIFGQGWLFGRPVPAEEFKALLAADEAKTLVPAVPA
jgi:sensor c-di-GMP phosphodiesterase-like protein